jgi:hypothetical protein
VRLLTIDDLTAPDNDWKPLLDHVAALQAIWDKYKATYHGDRHFPIHIGGDGHRAPGIHASEICGCLRQATYSLIGTENNADTDNANINMQKRFDIGHMVHALIQDDFQRMCMLTDGRIVFTDEARITSKTSDVAAKFQVSSSTDGIFVFYDEHDNPYLRVALEIKSMSGPEFEKANKPKEPHVMQGTLYQKCFDVPLIWFLYYNKSNSNNTPPLTPWIVPFDRGTWNRLESRMVQAHDFARQGTLPDREEGMPCSWCSYAKTCEPSYNRMAAARQAPAPTRKARKLT